MGDKEPGSATVLTQGDGLCFSAQNVPSNAKIWSVSVFNQEGKVWSYSEKDPQKQLSASKQCVLFLPEYLGNAAPKTKERFAVSVATTRSDELHTTPYSAYFCAKRTAEGRVHMTPIASHSTAC